MAEASTLPRLFDTVPSNAGSCKSFPGRQGAPDESGCESLWPAFERAWSAHSTVPKNSSTLVDLPMLLVSSPLGPQHRYVSFSTRESRPQRIGPERTVQLADLLNSGPGAPHPCTMIPCRNQFLTDARCMLGWPVNPSRTKRSSRRKKGKQTHAETGSRTVKEVPFPLTVSTSI